MKRSQMGWAVGVVAPWCLAVGLLVSITADAGQMAVVGGSFANLSSRATPEPDDLVPAAALAAHRPGDFASFGLARSTGLIAVNFDPGTPDDFRRVSDEIEPRQGGKRPGGTNGSGPAPAIDRTRKGDPTLDLRPTFDSQLRRRSGPRAAQMLGPHDDAMPAASFSLADEGAPLDGATSFAPWAAGEDMQADPDAGGGSGRPSVATALSMRPAALRERLAQGATPKVSRAEALSSTTPAEGPPVAAVLGPLVARQPEATILPRAGAQPNYAALLAGEGGARERKCLAEAVYFEARSEPEEGQAAVAQVVLNRATSGLYPASICGVVYQNRSHYKACQFSFACEGKLLRVTEPESWRIAVRIADAVVDGRTYLSDVGGATHYHASYVRPGWARRLVKMDVIGHHVFYKLRRGQS